MSGMHERAVGLRFPEGPVAMPDGSVVLVECARGTLSRVAPDGAVSVIAEPGGGPNGAALGPDGRIYLCNNGGFRWHEVGGRLLPGTQPEDYSGGRIEAVDPATGAVEVLYRESDRGPLNGPNDLVFDGDGGFWFTDHGKTREREMDLGYLLYGRIDGSECREVVRGLITPNGVGLSPDDSRVYVAETLTGRVWQWDVTAPGELRLDGSEGAACRGRLLAGLPGHQLLDSLAVDAEGWVCVATIHNGGITAIAPDGGRIEHVATDDPVTTNICFGGADLKTAYLTLSSTGRLVSCTWPRAGLPLHFLNPR